METKNKIDKLLKEVAITHKEKNELMSQYCRKNRETNSFDNRVNDLYRKWQIDEILS